MNASLERIEYANTIQLEGVFTVVLHESNIIEVSWSNEVKEIEKNHLIQLNQAFEKLGKGKKMRVYINILDFMNFNEESRAYSTTEQAERFTLASAVQIDNLAKKILFNFYLKFNKPNIPIRAFSDRDQAFKWLLSLAD